MNEVEGEIDGRAISREVLASWIGAWREGWLVAGRMQDRNPDLLRLGLAASDDPAEAIDAIVPVLATLHPRFRNAVVAMLGMVEEELGIPVSPPRDDVGTRSVDVDPWAAPSPAERGHGAPRAGLNDDGGDDVERESVGGDQLYVRVAKLEESQAVIDDLACEVRGLLVGLAGDLESLGVPLPEQLAELRSLPDVR